MDQHESLAICMGAKLTGPRLLRGIESFFDGPINTSQPVPFLNPISWLDVVGYTRSNPKDYTLVHKSDGTRWCQFIINGTQVEITENDWRLVWSGALDRFPLEQPLEEDEVAEVTTLEILEQRTAMLCQKADEVAARAHSLNRRLGRRKEEIQRHRVGQRGTTPLFPCLSQTHGGPGCGSSYNLRAHLLQQFMAASEPPPHTRSISRSGLLSGNVGQQSPPHSNGDGPITPVSHSRHNSSFATEPALDSREDVVRSLVAQRLSRLHKGDDIDPPCDRCRRLKMPCVKHLTACVGCTKKHAKCGWKAVTEEEMGKLQQETDVKGTGLGEDEGGSDVSDTTLVQDCQCGSSGERCPGIRKALAMIEGVVSKCPPRDGPQLSTLEPPVSALMNRFDLGSERLRKV